MQLACIETTRVCSLSMESCNGAKPTEARNSSIRNSHAIKNQGHWTSTLSLESAMLTQCITNESCQFACLLQSRGPNSIPPVARFFASTLPRPSLRYAMSDSHVAACCHPVSLHQHTTMLSLGDAHRVSDLV